MPYRLKRKESTAKGVQRIAREQIDRARAELARESPASGETVHQVRKRIKKLRALLRLLKPRLGHASYKTGNRRLRNMGHGLAGSRDADVMLQTLDGLERELRNNNGDLNLSGLRGVLLARQAAQAGTDSDNSDSPGQAVAGEFAELQAQVRTWAPDKSGFAAAGAGLRSYYRRGRKALQQARKHPGDRKFHDWRKRVKDHWYHCRLLQYLWPAPLRTRADELKILSDLLGDEHDLAVFRKTLKALPDNTLSPADSALLHAASRDRQRALRASALRLGLRVYAEKPGHIHKRFRRYAKAART